MSAGPSPASAGAGGDAGASTATGATTGPIAMDGPSADASPSTAAGPQLEPAFGVAVPGGQPSRSASARLSHRSRGSRDSRGSTTSHTSEAWDEDEIDVAGEGQGPALHGVSILTQISADLDVVTTKAVSVPVELLRQAKPYWTSQERAEIATVSTAGPTTTGATTGPAQSAGLVAPMAGLPSGPGTAVAPPSPGQRTGVSAGLTRRARAQEASAYSFCGEGVSYASEPATVFVASLPDQTKVREYEQLLLLYTRAPGQPMLRLRALKVEHLRHSRRRKEERPAPQDFAAFCKSLPNEYLVIVIAEPAARALSAPAGAPPGGALAFSPVIKSLGTLATVFHPRRAWGSLVPENVYVLPDGGVRLGLPAPPEEQSVVAGSTGAQLLLDVEEAAALVSLAAPQVNDAIRASLAAGDMAGAWEALGRATE